MPLSVVNLPVSILKEGKYYVAYSPALDLSTSAKNFEDAKKRFGEVVQIFFEELVEKGTIDEVLTSLGWQRIQKSWSPPIEVSHKLETIKIPQFA